MELKVEYFKLFLICSMYIHASKIHSYLFVFYILQLKEEVRPYLYLILENTNLLVIFFCMCSMFCRTLNSVQLTFFFKSAALRMTLKCMELSFFVG